MSAPHFTSDSVVAADSDLAAIVADYANTDELPPADWLTRLELERPQTNLRSIDLWTRRVKRTLDVFCAVVMLVLLTPVMLLVALAVKLTSPGPVLFRQIRTGLNLRTSRDRRGASATTGGNRRQQSNDRRQATCYGKPFVLYKFRTMRIDAEKNGAQFATKGDPRVTPIGRFLRKSRLDELPQLWNVLRGEMSLVGPRPERPEFIEHLSQEVPDYLLRLGIQPGLTGLAQVLNGYDNDIAGFRRKVALDLLYLQNCCLANDLKILFRTVSVVLTGKGAL
ncbi:MAG: sugar transferase [Planctomycetaceae bacterium]